MELATIVSSATVAFAVAGVFRLFALAWWGISEALFGRRAFEQQIFVEAAERLRHRVRDLETRCAQQLASILVFLLCLGVLVVAGGPPWWPSVPAWAWIVVAAALVGTFLHELRKLAGMFSRRAEFAYRRDANIAFGHALLHSVQRGHRVFHSVQVDGETIDNVVVGPNGIYAINVIALEARDAAGAELNGSRLTFEPTNRAVSLRRYIALNKKLGAQLGRVVGTPVNVLSVIGVPGCRVATPKNAQHLVLDERNIVALSGWRVPDAFLMNEDAEKICVYLMKQARKPQGRRGLLWRLRSRRTGDEEVAASASLKAAR